jgi:hypothetical protein
MINSDDDRTDLLWAWRTAVDNNESHTHSVAAWMSIAGEIAKSPDLVATLLREHVPTPDGGLCARCGRAGCGTPWLKWPCALAAVALVADRMRADREA